MGNLNTIRVSDPGVHNLLTILETQARVAADRGAQVTPSILIDGKEVTAVALQQDDNGAFFINLTTGE